MGRPYERELALLPETYSWALSEPADAIRSLVGRLQSRTLVGIGSGGSYTTAVFACDLHCRATSQLGVPLTPLNLAGARPFLRDAGALLFTAGGRNADAIQAFDHLVALEPSELGIFCRSRASPLGKAAKSLNLVRFVEVAPPGGKDGFLATNSILAAATLLQRGYSRSNSDCPLPAAYSDLVPTHLRSDAELDDACTEIWPRNTTLILHGPETRAAAVDLESKFTEAGLGNAQISDFRHFAHGRHYWTAKHAETTAIISLSTSADAALADATLALIPPDIPVHRWEAPAPSENGAASLAAIVHAVRLAGSAGRWLGEDPGRPVVPRFGRRIYSLGSRTRYQRPISTNKEGLSPGAAISIARKVGSRWNHLLPEETTAWRSRYDLFVQQILAVSFSGIVFDYDGTLCDSERRFDPLDSRIIRHLLRILAAGVRVGVATGRGKSARESLRDALPSRLWEKVLVGYYNGGDVAPLSDAMRPALDKSPANELTEIRRTLTSDPILSSNILTEIRPKQLTITAVGNATLDEVFHIVQAVLALSKYVGVRAFRSGHSVDVVAPGVSKSSVLASVVGGDPASPDSPEVLAVGDQGDPSGNDAELLSHRHSLSVDRTSPLPHTCWNLAPRGIRGVEATLFYLEQLHVGAGTFRLEPKGMY